MITKDLKNSTYGQIQYPIFAKEEIQKKTTENYWYMKADGCVKNNFQAVNEYFDIRISDPHSTFFELFDPTRTGLFQYLYGICH